ncbi:MAG: YggS family pyridoxal phosphate-dependent enzyme [Firmicutes bacterium]|nr:YggS family pyridoxal phosphate-dependent enzyme [Bacillota bacterium]
MSISENIRSVKKRIELAARRRGRDPSDITLVVVSKNRPVSAIREVIDQGITDIGENRAQEILPKYEAIGDQVKWHFIGHLQRNKVKYIVPFVYLIQSVDSIELAAEINKRANKVSKVQDVLLEVNVSGEATKHGFSAEKVIPAIEELRQMENIRVKGLMTMAPFTDNVELIRPYFARLRVLFNDLSGREGPNVKMRYLSMGMTNDFEVAIEEGSNMVRIGTAIFKP